MINIIPQQYGMLHKSYLTILVEHVEKKYGSVAKAPLKAMKPIWHYIRKKNMGSPHYAENHTDRTARLTNSKPIHKSNRGGVQVATRFWQSGINKFWYCNKIGMVKAVDSMRKNPNQSVTKVAHQFHTEEKQLSNAPVAHRHIQYVFGNIKISAYARTMLIGKLRKSHFPLAPQSLRELSTHDYLGSVRTYWHYDPLYYSKIIPNHISMN